MTNRRLCWTKFIKQLNPLDFVDGGVKKIGGKNVDRRKKRIDEDVMTDIWPLPVRNPFR